MTMVGENYGSALQAYALQQVIKESGGETSIVSLRPKSYIFNFLRNYLIPTKYDGIREKYKKIVSNYKNKIKRKKIHDFYKNNINIEKYKSLNALKKLDKHITFICGSDQIWNPQFQPNRLFYLDYSFDLKAKKYSYAASLAVSAISKEQEDYYRQKLKGFEILSVREKTGKKLLEDAVHKPVRVDVDPVLLYDVDKWKKIKSSRFVGKKYVLLYMLRPMPELLRFAKNIANKERLELIYIGDCYYKDDDITYCCDAGVEDFLDAIYSASYVVTNSFHATVFSILFRKLFCSYAVSRTGTRVQDFLIDIGLPECQIEDLDNKQYSFYDSTDWEQVFLRIKERRELSLRYIKEIVDQDK